MQSVSGNRQLQVQRPRAEPPIPGLGEQGGERDGARPHLGQQVLNGQLVLTGEGRIRLIDEVEVG